LLLSDITRHFAVDLASAEGHSQSLCHVFLYRGRDVRVLIRRSNPDLSRPLVLEFAPAQLCQVCATNEGKNYIGREACFDGGFEAERVGGINENAGMLGGHDGIDN